jgi:ParB/RepB/Spo0J family partition protein
MITATADRLSERTLANVPVAAITPNPNQPRKTFKGIDELAGSIRANGLLQPITLRPRGDGTYLVVAGERRFRAVSSLGWETIPAIVIDNDAEDTFRLAVLENMARKDMSPVEEARSLKTLLETMTVSEVAAAVGYGSLDGNQITWKVKLLDAIEELQELVNKGHLRQTQAIQASRLSRNGQLKVLRLAGERQLSDREWGALCDTIYSQEHQLDMFPETKLDPKVLHERRELQDAVDRIGKEVRRLESLKLDIITRGNRQAAVDLHAQIEETIRALSRVNRTIQSEAGRALAFEDAQEGAP